MKVFRIKGIVIFAGILLCAYPVFVLSYTWAHVAVAEFPGGRGGPLDAYRHTLASAVVAYTADKQAVDLASRVLERSDSRSNEMDKHNNNIGAQIGLRAKSFFEIEPTVIEAIKRGSVNATSSNQITWLTRECWRDGLLW